MPRDDFDEKTKNILMKRAAFICSNPECMNLTIAPSLEDNLKVIYAGKVAHITAASKEGPRFDPEMNFEERKSTSNGIFLCSNCAEIIDKNKGADFSVSLLKDWKNNHESWVRKNLNKKISGLNQPLQVFNTTSINQTGGITAGVVHIEEPKQRKLNNTIVNELLQKIPNASQVINVVCVVGDMEAFKFATEIKKVLMKKGYKVNGVSQAVFSAPIIGQTFDPKTSTITIGSIK